MRAHADGLADAEAAAELIGNCRWLGRYDFVEDFVEIGRGGLGDDTVLAVIDWQAAVTALDAGRLPCSSSEGRLLRIAASIAGHVPVCLGAVLGGLDEDNITLVVKAVQHANGARRA